MGYKARHTELDSRDVVAEFFPAFEGEIAGAWASSVGMMIDSDRETESYNWPGSPKGLREWEGERKANELNKFSMTLTNKPYEDTMILPLADLRRDKTAFLRRRVQEMARKAAQHWNALLTTLIEANTATCYDGQNFFDTTHDESGSNQINEVTNTHVPALDVATVAAPTAEEMVDIMLGMIGYLYTYTDDQGDPTNGGLRTFQFQTNSARTWAAMTKAIGQNFLSSGETNVLGTLDGYTLNAVLNTRLTSTSDNKIYMYAMDGPLLPFVLQDEEPLTSQLLGAGSDFEFDHDAHKFGIKTTRAVGYGDWKKAMRGTIS